MLLIGNFRLDKFRQQRQRFLPTEVASFRGYGRGHSFLRDIQFGSAEYLPQRNRRLHFSGQVWIVEFVRVADAFVGRQFMISSAERVALSGAEIRERHLVGAADFRVQVMDLARESIWRKPFRQGVRIEKGPINSLRRRPEYTVESDGIYFVDLHNFSGFKHQVSDRCTKCSFLRRRERALQDNWRPQISVRNRGSRGRSILASRAPSQSLVY